MTASTPPRTTLHSIVVNFTVPGDIPPAIQDEIKEIIAGWANSHDVKQMIDDSFSDFVGGIEILPNEPLDKAIDTDSLKIEVRNVQ